MLETYVYTKKNIRVTFSTRRNPTKNWYFASDQHKLLIAELIVMIMIINIIFRSEWHFSVLIICLFSLSGRVSPVDYCEKISALMQYAQAIVLKISIFVSNTNRCIVLWHSFLERANSKWNVRFFPFTKYTQNQRFVSTFHLIFFDFSHQKRPGNSVCNLHKFLFFYPVHVKSINISKQ